MTLDERTQILASNIGLNDNMSLLRIVTLLNNTMNSSALKLGHIVDDQRRIALSQRPVINVLDPVLLEIPAISWKVNDCVCAREVALVIGPIDAGSSIIETLEGCGEHVPGCSATLEGANACDLLAEGGLDHAGDSWVRSNFKHH